MPSLIWNKLCETFSTILRPARKNVSFSPSVIQREITRYCRQKPSKNAFLNFLAEIRAGTYTDRYGQFSRKSSEMAIKAGCIWNSMKDEEKQPYRAIATEQKQLKRLQRRPRSALYTRKKRRSNTNILVCA